MPTLTRVVSAVLLFMLPVAASARDRESVMADAQRYAEHPWQMKAENQKASCKADYKSDHKVGSQVGVPYAWGGSMSLDEFDRRISKGEAAGSHSKDGVLACVAGVDCSGFVSQVWQLPARQSTSSMSAVSHAISLEELQPGDALNKAGSHIVLYAGSSADGKPIIYEASGSASRVRMATPSWSYLAGYQPIRYNGLQEPVAAAAPKEKTPATAPASNNVAFASGTATASQPASAPATAQAPAATPAPAATATPAPKASTVPAVATAPTTPPAAEATTPAGVARVDAPAPAAPANRSTRVSLRFGTDVGFTPGGEDAQAIGPDYLVAGPNGVVALYDRVRHQVLILSRDGSRKAVPVENSDGLDFTSEGNLVVLDGVGHRVQLFKANGTPVRTVELPRDGILGKGLLTLESGVLYLTNPQGQRRAIAELSDGRFKPTRRERELDANQVLQWKERGSRYGLVEVGGEKLAVPPSMHVAARNFGPWFELTASWTDEQGRLRVRRTMRKPHELLELPTADQGAYAPLADLAVVPGGKTVVYLAPEAQAVSVVWVDAES